MYKEEIIYDIAFPTQDSMKEVTYKVRKKSIQNELVAIRGKMLNSPVNFVEIPQISEPVINALRELGYTVEVTKKNELYNATAVKISWSI